MSVAAIPRRVLGVVDLYWRLYLLLKLAEIWTKVCMGDWVFLTHGVQDNVTSETLHYISCHVRIRHLTAYDYFVIAKIKTGRPIGYHPVGSYKIVRQESCAIAKMTAQCALKLNAQSFPKTGNPKNVENLTTFTRN